MTLSEAIAINCQELQGRKRPAASLLAEAHMVIKGAPDQQRIDAANYRKNMEFAKRLKQARAGLAA
jgi:hypothetical protein